MKKNVTKRMKLSCALQLFNSDVLLNIYSSPTPVAKPFP